MSERWIIVPGEDERVDVLGVLDGCPSRRVVARNVLPVDAEVMVAQQDGLASTVQTLQRALEWALQSGQHHQNCPTRRGRDGESACFCWRRNAHSALESTARDIRRAADGLRDQRKGR